jgi:AraC-like DNA-binding protein
MKPNGQMIETLANSQMFQDYERAYNEATGLPVTLRAVETWQLPLHRRRRENSWCAMMAENSRSCAACLQMQERLAGSAMDGPCTLTCAYGLSETLVPVKLGPQTIGFLQTGQVLQHKPTEAKFQRAFAKTAELGVELDQPRARQAYFKTPVLSQRKMESITGLLAIFADHLSMRSNQIAVSAANSEPPSITRAKRFIGEHHMEDLSLSKVAAAVHMGLFTLCKMFRKATGIGFTEYVSRTRVEKAKNLLLNPNLRVSEVAFAVGFQSLTHFNRVFKKIVGESPTEHREKLHVKG